jgi:hypothetical protein
MGHHHASGRCGARLTLKRGPWKDSGAEVYLTYFKRGQPVLNWLDPSYAGPKVVIGDLTNMVHNLGARVM